VMVLAISFAPRDGYQVFERDKYYRTLRKK